MRDTESSRLSSPIHASWNQRTFSTKAKQGPVVKLLGARLVECLMEKVTCYIIFLQLRI